MAKRCAVIGVGQTRHESKRIDVSQVGLVREAAIRALEDAELTWKDIDAVVIGKAPDLFEGVMMPELFLAEALGGTGKPMLRVHTAGSVGGSTAIVAASLVEAGGRRAAHSAWVHATSMRTEPTQFAGRDQVNPQAGKDCAKDLYAKAGIANPRAEIDCAEIYVPFSWFEPM